jgi:hypothetical protein
LLFSHHEHVEESSNFQSHAGSNIKILNSKVLEIRKIVGSAAMASGKGIISSTSPTKGGKNTNRSRNRSRSPTKQLKQALSDSSSNSLDNSGALGRQKRSKSPVKQVNLANRNTETKPIDKRRKKLVKKRSKVPLQEENISPEPVDDKEDLKENLDAEIETEIESTRINVMDDEDMDDFIRDDSSNASEMV